MKVFTEKLIRLMILAGLIVSMMPVLRGPALQGQEITGSHKIKWIRVGALQTWFSNSGAEVEYGRRGRNCCQETDQADQFYWDAQFEYQDRVCSKGFWLGCTNFDDPVAGKTFEYKVISAGNRFANVLTVTMPEVFKMVGRFNHPTVFVDNTPASDNNLNDVVDEVDENLKADRMIVSVLHTPMGLTITRKIYGFSQQNHDDYFIYDYVIKNTGIINLQGGHIDRTLTGVIFHLQERYAPGFTSHLGGWEVAGNSSWGANTVHRQLGTNPLADDFKYRAWYSWYHPHSQAPSYESDWGNPDHRSPRALGAPGFLGGLTLHADTGPDDQADDVYQPFGTIVIDSDHITSSDIDQYSKPRMTDKYNYMNAGHMNPQHWEIVGDQFGDKGSSAINGWDQTQNYGPYTLAPGDSIHVVQAEGVGGLNRALCQEIGTKWFLDDGPFDMPDGSTSDDRDAYKRAWVWTCEDSMMQIYDRAMTNYQSGFDIPQPPPPPSDFTVMSGGDKITLTWAENALSYPYFDGYRLYRAINRPDTLYEMIFSCDANNAVHEFEDRTAIRGFDYYYYIETKDDGSQNDIYPGVALVSSKFWTMTNTPAYLRRPAENKLDSIVVVPNPFHISAIDNQFGRTNPDRIAFYGLPKFCRIKIYTERGDLVDTIDHIDGSGDELWDSVTSSLQIVVSGLYIAYFEVTEDIIDEETGAVIFKKGESTYRKFVIIR
ncbi:hypothetical protein JW948_14325 [bacterium]|nr:hypothetical protein [bacterium]